MVYKIEDLPLLPASPEYIQSGLRYSWDPAKATSNFAKHGVDIQAVQQFGWAEALVRSDVRTGYPEPRLVAFGPIGTRLHVLVFSVERRGVRVISLRKAKREEIRRYAAEV